MPNLYHLGVHFEHVFVKQEHSITEAEIISLSFDIFIFGIFLSEKMISKLRYRRQTLQESI